MTTLNITVPRTVAEPRGAAWMAAAATAALRVLQSIGAHFRHTSVTLHDVTAMRDVARSYEGSDPRLAAELYAIADRHEASRGL